MVEQPKRFRPELLNRLDALDTLGYPILYGLSRKAFLGTLLATGSVMSPPRGMHLVEGDVVEITIPTLGRLANPVVLV